MFEKSVNWIPQEPVQLSRITQEKAIYHHNLDFQLNYLLINSITVYNMVMWFDLQSLWYRELSARW